MGPEPCVIILEGRGQWTENYIGIYVTVFVSSNNFGDFLKFDWLVSN